VQAERSAVVAGTSDGALASPISRGVKASAARASSPHASAITASVQHSNLFTAAVMKYCRQYVPMATFHREGAPSSRGCPILATWAGGAAGEFGRRRELQLHPRFGLPSRGRNRRFEAEPADNFLHLGIDPLRRGREGRDNYARGAFEIVALQPPQDEAAACQALQQEGADMRLVGIAAGD